MNDTEEALSIVKALEARGERPTWRMIYRRFSDDDFRLNNALVKLLEQNKIAYNEEQEMYLSLL